MTPAALIMHVDEIRGIYRRNPEWQRLDRLYYVAMDRTAAQALTDMHAIEYTACEAYIHENDSVDVIDFDDIRRAFAQDCESRSRDLDAVETGLINGTATQHRKNTARKQRDFIMASLKDIAARLVGIAAELEGPEPFDFLEASIVNTHSLATDVRKLCETYEHLAQS